MHKQLLLVAHRRSVAVHSDFCVNQLFSWKDRLDTKCCSCCSWNDNKRRDKGFLNMSGSNSAVTFLRHISEVLFGDSCLHFDDQSVLQPGPTAKFCRRGQTSVVIWKRKWTSTVSSREWKWHGVCPRDPPPRPPWEMQWPGDTHTLQNIPIIQIAKSPLPAGGGGGLLRLCSRCVVFPISKFWSHSPDSRSFKGCSHSSIVLQLCCVDWCFAQTGQMGPGDNGRNRPLKTEQLVTKLH